MKGYLLVCPLLVIMLNNLFGEVKNGYERELAGARLSLRSLQGLLQDEELPQGEKRLIRRRIAALINFMTYYEITDTLLRQFRSIAPELYNEIDTLKDSNGRAVDVYVKFIPKEQAEYLSAGMASFKQDNDDLNTCISEYGEGSVSVKIWILSKALAVLAHELGHVRYLVPNLRIYVKFYKIRYWNNLSDNMLGHDSGDPSGKSALLFEERFQYCYARYLEFNLNAVASPLVLIGPIKRNLLMSLDNEF